MAPVSIVLSTQNPDGPLPPTQPSLAEGNATAFMEQLGVLRTERHRDPPVVLSQSEPEAMPQRSLEPTVTASVTLGGDVLISELVEALLAATDATEVEALARPADNVPIPRAHPVAARANTMMRPLAPSRRNIHAPPVSLSHSPLSVYRPFCQIPDTKLTPN